MNLEDREPDAPEAPGRASGSIWREEWAGIGFVLFMLLAVLFGIGWLALSLL